MQTMFLWSQGKLICAALAFWPTQAFAHASERGQVMLLPTHLYIIGGALAVLASVIASLSSPHRGEGGAQRRRGAWQEDTGRAARPPSVMLRMTPPPQGGEDRDWRRLTSLLSFLALAWLVYTGLHGPPDPIFNPLPRIIWIWWWVGFTLLCVAFGNLWLAFNPWSWLKQKPLLRYPAWLGQWPAFALFFAFALFELVYPTPSDPARLATAIICLFAINAAGVILFGAAKWLENGDCFAVFFRMAGSLSPLQWTRAKNEIHPAFILLALATVSFDGFMRTFFWAGLLGINPLEFPGRSAVILANSIGLAAMFAVLAAAFALAARRELAITIVPIALAYHAAHYLPEIWPGTMMEFHTASLVYQLQTALIVAGHIMAVIAGHAMARGAVALNLLMVLYTGFGLWLLSTPVIS